MTIKIPSKNIYGTPIITRTRPLDKITGNITKFNKIGGNILQEPLSIFFRDARLSGDKKRIFFSSPSNPNNINVSYNIDFNTITVTIKSLDISPFFLKDYATNCTLKCKTRWVVGVKSKTTLEYDDLDYEEKEQTISACYIQSYDVSKSKVMINITFSADTNNLTEDSIKETYLLSTQITAIENNGKTEAIETQISVGEGTNILNNERNELLRDSYLSIIESQYSKYSTRKEIVELLCSFSKYYDYETENYILISDDYHPSASMVFEKYDEVIPMIRSHNGSDVPMFADSRGNPKTFVVLGTEIIYDGAMWQKIYLQEI